MFIIMLNDSYSVVKVTNKGKFITISFICGQDDAWTCLKVVRTLLTCMSESIAGHRLHLGVLGQKMYPKIFSAFDKRNKYVCALKYTRLMSNSETQESTVLKIQ